jgi:hypothetical protein
VTDAVIADRPPCRHGRIVGEKERAEEGDDRWGWDVREGERGERAGVAGLGHVAGPRKHAMRTNASGPFGWAEPEEGREGSPR